MTYYKQILLAASLSVLSGIASAVPIITGSVGFAGAYSHDGTTDLSDATAFSSFTGVLAIGTIDGTFATEGVTTGTAAAYSDFSFNPTSVPVIGLWSVLGFSFDLTSMSLDGQDTDSVELSGVGIIKHVGYDDTRGTWTFTANNQGSNFSFSSSATSAPEPALALLLGTGLIGFGVARKLRKKA